MNRKAGILHACVYLLGTKSGRAYFKVETADGIVHFARCSEDVFANCFDRQDAEEVAMQEAAPEKFDLMLKTTKFLEYPTGLAKK